MGVKAIPLVVLYLKVSCPTASCQPQMRNYMNVGTGRRLMPPICLSLMSSSAEILQGSQSVLHSAHRGVRRRRPYWHFGTWNIQSLLDSKGSVDTACQGFDCHQVSEDQRIDLVVRELNRYVQTSSCCTSAKWCGKLCTVCAGVL